MSRVLVLSLVLAACGPAGAGDGPRPIAPSLTDEQDPAGIQGISDDDGDDFPNDSDGCPAGPEDADNFEDQDGCPDPDNDRDNVPDIDDKCPNDPETYGGGRSGEDNEHPDGCPE